MDPRIIDIIVTCVLALISAYVAWVHHRQSRLDDRVRELESRVAAFGDVRQSLRDMDLKLDGISRVVYLIAGKEGVSA